MYLDAKKVMFAIKLIKLDAKKIIEKKIIALIFKFSGNCIYRIMALKNQDTIILFEIVMLVSEIRYPRIVLLFQVFYFIGVVIKEQCS